MDAIIFITIFILIIGIILITFSLTKIFGTCKKEVVYRIAPIKQSKDMTLEKQNRQPSKDMISEKQNSQPSLNANTDKIIDHCEEKNINSIKKIQSDNVVLEIPYSPANTANIQSRMSYIDQQFNQPGLNLIFYEIFQNPLN